MTTFAELGIPFPLFEAPVSEASSYLGISRCEVCEQRDQHCFRLYIGDCVVVQCPQCETENGLRADKADAGVCSSCESSLAMPGRADGEGVRICFSCLRDGRGALGKDTEFGMVSWDFAVRGHTHGIPGLQTTVYETVVIDADEGWLGVRMPKEQLFELLRTPAFHTWQGEIWMFCCKSPMTYVGDWHSVSAPLEEEQSRNLFTKLAAEIEEFGNWGWESVSDPNGPICLYVFQCKKCEKYRANYDMD